MITYIPSAVKRPIPFRGVNSSSDQRDIQSEIITDLNGLAQACQLNFAELLNQVHTLRHELQLTQNTNSALETGLNTLWKTLALEQQFVYVNSMFNTRDIFYHPSTPQSRMAIIEEDYGVALPPRDNIQPLMYYTGFNGTDIVLRKTNTVINTSIGDVEDWENSDNIDEGSISYAFHPDKNRTWVRKVAFPLHEDKQEVRMQLILDVPQTGFHPNLLKIMPYPYGVADILNIEFAPDGSSGYRSLATIVPHLGSANSFGEIEFLPIYNCQGILVHFPAQPIAKLKITFGQRSSQDQAGYKVFEYGAREIGLFRAVYDPINSESDIFSHTLNNNLLIKVTAPEGFFFDRLLYFNSDPFDRSNRFLRWEISADPNFADEVVWNSTLSLPQATTSYEAGSNVAGVNLNIMQRNRTEIWVKGILAQVDAGIVGSPFMVGTPAFINSVNMGFKMQPRT